MAMVYKCSDDVAAVTFIVRPQIDQSFCKHLIKHDTTNMKILYRAKSTSNWKRRCEAQRLDDSTSQAREWGRENHILLLRKGLRTRG